MSRQIDFNDPSSWDDDDKAYLRDRVELVPVEHREHLIDRPPIAPASAAESPDIDRLRAFLVSNFPEEMSAAGAEPVGVAIQLLTEEYETTSPDEESDADDTYDSWKVPELKDEVTKRQNAGEDITPASDKKADLIAALRASDSAKL
jgi:hypothetical protein